MANTLQLFSLVNFGYGDNTKSERIRFITNDYEFKFCFDTGTKGSDNKTKFEEVAAVSINLEKLATLKLAFLDQYSKLMRTRLWEIRKEGKPTTLHNIYVSCPGDENHKLYALRFVTGCTFDANQKMTTQTKWMVYGLESYDEYKNIKSTKEFPKNALLAEFTLSNFASTDGEPFVSRASVQMDQFASVLESIMAGTHAVYGHYLQDLKSSDNKSSSEKTYSKKSDEGTSNQAPSVNNDDFDDEFPF